MMLTPGMRLSRDARTSYQIIERAWTGARHDYFLARKVFWNFRYPAEVLDEAGADEWLDVLVRVPRGEATGSHDVALEWRAVFERPTVPWMLEPIDLLDPPATGSPSSPVAPLLVLADPHAARLSAGPPPDREAADRLARVLSEIPAMLGQLHHGGLAAGPLEPGDFLVDSTGRWFYLGTDRIATGSGAAARDDRDHWSRLVSLVLTGSEEIEGLDPGPWAEEARRIHRSWR